MTETKKSNALLSVLTSDEVRSVSPALERYTKEPLLNGLWNRPELSPHDPSLVTVSALIARIQAIEMPFHFALALDNGVKASELSETITPPGLLRGMGECDIGCLGRKGYLQSARDRHRSIAAKPDRLGDIIALPL